jgi:hypothetical protein
MENNVGQAAQKLARNPLGIIALFIVLVYGIAGLVLGLSISKLENNERLVFVIFIISFPVIVLGVFGWLVVKHHTKLYAPNDFFDKEGFFRALTPVEQKIRLDRQVESIHKEISSKQINNPDPLIDSRYKLRTKLALVEELAIREIEEKFKVNIARQVQTRGGSQVDGAFINPKDNRQYLVEVNYSQSSDFKQIIESAKYTGDFAYNEGSGYFVYLILYIVTEGVSYDEAKKSLMKAESILYTSPNPISLHWIDYTELKEKYGYFESE